MFETGSTSTRKPELPQGDITLLVSVLGRTDAIWTPCRDVHLLPAISQLRRQYEDNGVRWDAQANDDAERKQAEKVRDRLTAHGYLTILRRRRIKLVGVKLTNRGEAIARAAVGIPSLTESVKARDLIGPAGEELHGLHLGRKYVPETWLAGTTYRDMARDPSEKEKLVELQDKLLPCLVRGWVESICDARRHVWYTTGGQPRTPRTPPESSSVEPTDEFIDAYEDARATAKAEIATMNVDSNEIGIIPFPVSPAWGPEMPLERLTRMAEERYK